MNKITNYYYQSALELGLDVKPSKIIYGFEFNIGKHKYYIRNGFIPINNSVSTNIAHDKYTTNRILNKAGFPVPDSVTFTRKAYREKKIDTKNLPYPIVVKPAIGSAFGMDVVCNIKDESFLTQYLEKAFAVYPQLTIEHFEQGLTSYRVLVLGDEIIGLVERTPAFVIGNGTDNLEKLIKDKNDKRKEIGLPNIVLSHETKIIFSELGLYLESVPKEDEFVPLRYVCNYSQGGTFASLPVSEIHPDNYKMIIDAAKTLNLQYVGYDVLCDDIRKPIKETRGFFIEANPNPGIFFHEEPFEGEPVQVSKMVILKQLAQHPFHYFLFKCKRHWLLTTLISLGLLIGLGLALYFFLML